MALPINIEDLLNKRKVEGNRIEFFAEQSDKVERKKGWILGIPSIQENLAANGSPRATFETTEDRLTFLIHISVHAGWGNKPVSGTDEENSPVTTETTTVSTTKHYGENYGEKRKYYGENYGDRWKNLALNSGRLSDVYCPTNT